MIAVASGGLLVATMPGDHTTQPTGPVWLPVVHSTRLRLAHLSQPAPETMGRLLSAPDSTRRVRL
jgi:hypothetical protein